MKLKEVVTGRPNTYIGGKVPGTIITPESKVYGAYMGPTWGRQDPGGPHVGPMNLAIWDSKWWLMYYYQIVVLITPSAYRQRDSITTRYSMYIYD